MDAFQRYAQENSDKGWDLETPEGQRELAAVLADLTVRKGAEMKLNISAFRENVLLSVPYSVWRANCIDEITWFFQFFVDKGLDPEIITRALFERLTQAVSN